MPCCCSISEALDWAILTWHTTTLGLKFTTFQDWLVDGKTGWGYVKVMVIHNPCFKLLKQCLCYAASGRAMAFGWLLMEQNYLNWENHTLFHNISVKENYSPPPSWESEPIVPLVSIISCEMVSWSKSALITPSFSLSLASSLVFSSVAGEPLQITNQQKLRTLNIFPDVSFRCFRSCTGSLKSHTNVTLKQPEKVTGRTWQRWYHSCSINLINSPHKDLPWETHELIWNSLFEKRNIKHF